MKLPQLLLLVITFAFAFSGTALAADAEFETLLKKGEYHASRYEEEAALKNFLAAEKLRPENAGLLTAISKEYRHLMSEAKSKKAKLAYGQTALSYAERAAAAGPRDSHAQLATGITLGKLVPFLSNKEKLAASKRIKSSADRAIAINPKNDTAWFVLGRWNQGFAGMSAAKRKLGSMFMGDIPKTTFADAAACFRRAVQLAPNRPMHHIELGSAYEGMGKAAQAKRSIKHGLSLPETEKDDPTTKAEGREILRKMGS